MEGTKGERAMENVDVVVIGGGAAGSAAALALGRSGRRVILLSSGEPRNAATARTTGIPWLEPLTSSDLQDRAHAQLRDLDGFVRIEDAAATSVVTDEAGVIVGFNDGAGMIHARAVVLATGVNDQVPAIPGVAGHWGSRVFGCPTCHGFEARGRRIATIGGGLEGALLTLHLARWSPRGQAPTLITPVVGSIPAEMVAKLRAAGVLSHESSEPSLRQVERELHITISDGITVACDVVFTRAQAFPHNELALSLGCMVGEEGHILVDEKNRTSCQFVYAAGDVAQKVNVDPTLQVLQAAADGCSAGLACDQDLFAIDLQTL